MPTTTAATLAKSLATTIARGAILTTTLGYTVAPISGKPGVYTCTKPADQPVKAGEKSAYTVDVAGGTCDCPMFARCGECKHLIGTTAAVAQALALVGPMLPEPVAVTVPAAKVSKVGRYGSEQWKASVARDFC